MIPLPRVACPRLVFSLLVASLLFASCGDDSGSSSGKRDAATASGHDAAAARDSGSGGTGAASDAGGGTMPDAAIPDGDSVETHLTASKGGMLETQDGARLVIPPGALADDTTVRITVPSDQMGPADMLTYVIEPTGLELSKPATLVVPYDDLPNGDPPPMMVMDSSIANTEFTTGSETSNWEYPEIQDRDMDGRTLSIEVDHFSFWKVAIAVDDLAYLVVDVPHAYLMPGDLVFTLTSELETKNEQQVPKKAGADWKPGHVGVFAEQPRVPCTNKTNQGKIVEATPPKVQSNPLKVMREEPGHVYLGPRRPKGGLTPEEGMKVVDVAKMQIGQPYALTGDGAISSGREFSCVGLTEFALGKVGKGVLTGFQKGTVATPIESFRATSPVDTITIDEEKQFTMPVYGVIVHPDSPYTLLTLRGFYCGPQSMCCPAEGGKCNGYKIEASQLPPGASLQEAGGRIWNFKWTPTHDQANQTFSATFVLTANPSANVVGAPIQLGDVRREQTMQIKVSPCPRVGPIKAVFDQDSFSTTYTAPIENPNMRTVTMQWKGPDCGTWSPQDVAGNKDKKQTASMTWTHPHPPCDMTTDHADRTIVLEVLVDDNMYTCTYQGAASGTGPVCTRETASGP